MNIALISDIHGNLPALKATLDDIQTQGVDQVIFLGDAATLGSFPKETLDLLDEWNCTCIMGNHDAAILDPARAADFQIAPPLIPSLEWTRERITEKNLDFIRSFLPTFELDLGYELSLFCYHGSPRSNIELVLSNTSEKAMDNLFAGQTADLMAGGHTHVQMLRQRGDQLIINPGSVGSAFLQPFIPGGNPPILLPWAEYALVHVEKNSWNVDLRRVRFDTQLVERAAIETGNPIREQWHTKRTESSIITQTEG